jgi:aminoglycoside phosphotransferase (APT) family kinase protein
MPEDRDANDGEGARPDQDMTRSSRDPDQVRAALETWLADRVDGGGAARPEITELHASEANGMSSETLLFDARWDGEDHHLVARVAPEGNDVPVFPSYDLTRQYEVIGLVAEHAGVPTPRLWWDEPDPSVLGTPFFVMSRVDGRVPPDVMPYTFGDNWLFDATPAEQRTLQDSSVEALAAIHSLAASDERFSFLAFDLPGATPLERHLEHTRRWYQFCVDGFERSPLLERALGWLGDHLPTEGGGADDAEAVVCWGDSRIGNVIYDGFTPAAILDWEMAAVGPREIELGWIVYSHQVFNDLSAKYGGPGMPDFLQWDDVAATYERASGHTPRDPRWYTAYAAVQYGIVFLRTGQRSLHFAGNPPPDDIDDLLLNRDAIERLTS